jgi:diguanylate cyclase (GGDEF)-like protein
MWSASAQQAQHSLPPLLLPTLTTARQVHSLSYQESLYHYPVHLAREQVLYYNPALGNLFVRDSTGLYVDTRGLPDLHLRQGDLLEIEGVSGPGGYAPVVEHPRIRVIGRAPLPLAPRFSLDHLLTGVEDSQWAEVVGTVHSTEAATHVTRYANQAASGGTTVQIAVATGAGHLDVIVREANSFDYKQLVDCKVLVRGVMGPRFNQARQLTGIHMFAQNLAQFRVLQRPRGEPSSLSVRAIRTVMQYTPDTAEHRVRVQGVVTAIRDARSFSIADESGGIFVHTADIGNLTVGDVADVAGFPAMGNYTPILEDAVYRKIGTRAPPAPMLLEVEDLFRGVADSELVRVRGRLLNHNFMLQGQTLLLAAGDRTFFAILPARRAIAAVSDLRDGSMIEVTGTCIVDVSPDKTPKDVEILLRSPADVVVIHRASWWTVGRAMAALTGLCVVVFIATAWIAALRRRVQRQTAALQKATEEADAIGGLATAMQEVASERKFTTRVSAGGSERIAQLGESFNQMLAQLEGGEQAKNEAEAKLQLQALTDELTGLPNRRLLYDRLSQCLALAKREGRIVALLYVDLDGFKLVNDSLGHTTGDLLLIQVAQRLRARLRHSDTLARLGGDEFTVLLNSLHANEEATLVATNLLNGLRRQFVIEGHEIVIGASIGISLFPEHGSDAVALLQEADSAMYAAKREGKNQVRCYTPELGSSVRERVTIESQLRGAIDRGEIHLEYQPEFDVSTRRLVRFEALARWTHPTLGSIPPMKFIPIAEESGLIITMGAYLLEQACIEAVKWQGLAPYPIQVAVNVSSLQFARPSFVDEVAQTLQYTGLKPDLLQIELTESIMLTGAERAGDTMKRLRAMGVNFAIDDFGTGYSCLSYLPRLPFNTLKIDRSFIHELETRRGAKAIVRSLVTLAHNLDMQVIVEGIETPQQLELVRALGSNEAQGILLGRPTPHPQARLALEADAMKFSLPPRMAASHTAGVE